MTGDRIRTPDEPTYVPPPEQTIYGLTALQVRVMLSATCVPQAASPLNGGMTAAKQVAQLDDLVAAGFLKRHVLGPRRQMFSITPAGREFATYLARLVRVREPNS